ncbi:MAG: sulfatase-like hydrolase/transferase, partial [Planctomycetes bacterium]|nr:sulfatase-like hydrolase/transferase [Planctomycetota bacterium]
MKILVLAVGGFHPGYLGCYGNDWIDTPALDLLAAEGIVFDQHYADRPEAAGARRAWRTGCYHFPLPEAGAESPAPAAADLVHLLKGAGIRTVLVGESSGPGAAKFAADWDQHFPVPSRKKGTQLEKTLDSVRQALDQLVARDRWLLWVELGSLRPPWEVPAEYLEPYFLEEIEEEEAEPEEAGSAESQEEVLEPLPAPRAGFLDPAEETTFARLQRTYAGAVTMLDAGLGHLFEDLEDRGLADQLHLLFTADSGLALGEHGLVGDSRPWLHEELFHVPLILRFPGGAGGGRRCSALTQAVDLLPTLLEWFGLSGVEVQGRSLGPLLRGEADQVRAYAAAGLEAGDAVEWALRTPGWGF